jgi:membrane-associated phospholipid phosphatase
VPAPLALALAALLGSGPGGEGGRSVYRIDPALDGAVLAVSSLAFTLPWLLEDQIIDIRCPCDPSEVPDWERFAIGNESAAATFASNVTVALSVLVPPAAGLLHLGWSRAWVEDLVVFAEALAVNGALVTAVKYTVQRPIPLAYAGDPAWISEPGSYRAFYSGHVSTVFTALTAAAWTARLRSGERVWPWLLAAAVGASVAVERVAGGHHFPSDVIVGAAMGVAVGTAVPLLHARRDPGRPVRLVPWGRGVALVGRF